MKKRKREKYSEEDHRTLFEDILDFVKVFAISAIVIVIVVNFIAHPVTVIGHSMDPTLNDGEYGFTSVISAGMGDIKRQDVVVLKMKDDNGKSAYWVKRIIGLPGETVECKDNVVYIDGVPLDESAYLKEDEMEKILQQIEEESGMPYGNFTDDFGPVTLKEDEYWVMGDNRPISKDSRSLDVGPVSKDSLFGKGVLVLWPLNKIGVH